MKEELIESGVNNLGDFIEKSLTKYADKDAFSCLGQTLTFSEIDSKSKALAAWLQQEANLSQGDRIAIQLPNLSQYPIAVYAALRAGLAIVNTNPLYTPREMQHQFKDSGAKALIILEDLLPKFDAIKADTDIETVIITGAADLLTVAVPSVDGCIALNAAIDKGTSHTLLPRTCNNVDEVALLQYTGGTTGVSKGASLTHRNIISNAAQTLLRFDGYCDEGEEIFVCPLPLYHIYAFTVNLVTFFGQGNMNILIPNPRDMDAFVNAIKPFKFTAFSGINTLFVGLCQQEAFKALDFSRFKLTVSGGTALTKSAADIWKQVTNCSISEGYGLSETSPVVCLNQPGNEELGTVGLPVPDTEVLLLDAEGNQVADGEEGEVCVKGPQVMTGYWNRQDETDNVFTENGFFKTGDMGVVTKSGAIKIVDRLKDMIIVSGFNVYPNEVEEVLVGHPNIMEAAVVGEQSDKTGEAVCAYITVNQSLNVEDVINYCREGLTAYKVPKKVVVMDELPKSTVGKILRRELRNT